MRPQRWCQEVDTHSMVVWLDPAENSPSMKIPEGKLDFPLKGPLLNSYSKIVVDMAMMEGVKRGSSQDVAFK
jgi:hypothetical protein